MASLKLAPKCLMLHGTNHTGSGTHLFECLTAVCVFSAKLDTRHLRILCPRRYECMARKDARPKGEGVGVTWAASLKVPDRVPSGQWYREREAWPMMVNHSSHR